MKIGWEVMTLGDAATFIMGQAPAGKDCNKDGKGVPFVKAGEFGKSRPIIREWTTDPKKFAKSTDVLICVVGATCGKINLGTDCAIGRSAAAIRPIEKQLDQFFLHYFLEGTVRELRAGSLGAAQTVISKDMLSELQIPLPPLEEQKRIVSILDEAFEGLDRVRENAEANLRSARELFESSLGAVFDHASDGWTKGTVGSMIHDGILEKPLDGNHGETHPKKSEFQSSGVPFIMASDLANGSVDQNNCYFISKSQAETLRKGFAKDGDVLISHKGTIGRTAVLRTDLDYVMLTPQVTYYRAADKNRLLPEFLYFYFHSATFLRVMRDLASVGSTRAYIGITKQHELPLLLPEISLQLELIDRFKSIEEIKNSAILSYKSKIQDIADLRQSLLQKAFAGELT